MASNHPLVAMLSTHLFTLWASHMGCTWIESCVFAFAILHLSRSFPVKLRLRDKLNLHAGDHVWSTWSCATFELGLVTQFRNFLFRGRGERILDIKKTIFKNLGKFKQKMKTWRIWIFTRHFGNISEAKTSTKRFCLPTKRRALRPLTSYSSV